MAYVLGLDIGKDALYGTLVRTAFRKTEIERYVRIPLAAEPGQADRNPELASGVRNLMEALGQPPDVVVTAMDGLQVSLRTVTLPQSAAKRVHDVLPFELESMLPYDIEDAAIDHQMLETRDGRLQLLVASCMKERLTQHLSELEQVGVDPRVLAAGAACFDGLPHLMPEMAGEGTTLLIDLGSDQTDVCFLRAGRPLLARSLTTGLDDLPGRADELWRGIQRTIAAHQAAGGESPDRVMLGGTGATAKGAQEWLADRLETQVDLMELPEAAGAEGPFRVPFMRSLALAGQGLAAGRHINLRIGEFASSQGTAGAGTYINLAAMCAVAVLFCGMFALKAQQYLLVDEQQALQSQLETVTQSVFGKPTADLATAQTWLKGAKAGDPLPRFDAFDALAVVSDSVPQEIIHEVRRLRIDVADDKREGRMELQGSVASIEHRDAIVTVLEEHDCFRDIERGRTTPARGKDEINYQIEATVQCTGDSSPMDKKRRTAK